MNSPPSDLDRLSENDAASFLASIVESSDDAIFGLTLEGVIVSWNKAAEEMFGYTAAEILGKAVQMLSPPDRIDEMERNLVKHRRGERVPHFDTVRITKDGRAIDVSVRPSTVRNATGAITGISVISRDITEQKRAYLALETANRVKTQFLNNMSHEIRTPMNGILGMTELVLETELTAEQREDLGLVKISTESLLTAIDDILDFSEIDAGKLSLETIPFNFRESLGETMKMLGFRAQKKDLELVYDIDPEIPVNLLGDPGRIRRILYNIIGNAIKFTAQGDVLLTVSQQSRAAYSITLQFSVKDTGIGISQEQQRRIFDLFSQADSTSTRKYGGTGLGLTIASRLIEMMNGKIRVESDLGKGSTFHFTVQLKVQEKAAANAPPIPIHELSGLQALIVDNNSVNRRVIKGMLNRWGMRATDVSDGVAALQALRIAEDIGHPFPLILLDGQMHGVDGFMVAEQIKEELGLDASTIMMLTSVGHVGDAARCRELGIAAYLVKPIGLNELAAAICMALKKNTDGESSPLVTRHVLREGKDGLPDK